MKLSSHWGLDKSIDFCRRPQKVDITSTFLGQILSKNVVIPPCTDCGCGYSSQTKELIISNKQFIEFHFAG